MKIYTKCGDKGHTSLIGGERVAKYNRLLRIEASLNSGAAYGKKCAEKTAKAEPVGVGQ